MTVISIAIPTTRRVLLANRTRDEIAERSLFRVSAISDAYTPLPTYCPSQPERAEHACAPSPARWPARSIGWDEALGNLQNHTCFAGC